MGLTFKYCYHIMSIIIIIIRFNTAGLIRHTVNQKQVSQIENKKIKPGTIDFKAGIMTLWQECCM